MSLGLMLVGLVALAVGWRLARFAIRLVLLTAVIAGVVIYAGEQTGADNPRTGAVARGRVVRVIDGDTLTVMTARGRVRVRLLGIDAPENSPTRYGRVDCGGDAARVGLARLARSGSRVRLVTDPGSGDTTDRYGRWLAYVDGQHGDLGEAQLAAGQALVYRYHGRRFSRLVRYQHAQASARTHRRGAWSGCRGHFHTSRR